MEAPTNNENKNNNNNNSTNNDNNNKRSFESLNFDNKALRVLPLDKEPENFVRQVPNAIFSRIKPMPVLHPSTVVIAPPALALLDLDPDLSLLPEYFSGNKMIPGTEPAAHCYCGYQFGYFSGQLGDGATMYLGEVVNSKGERWELQFKGAGKTPYSRTADGRKVLRSSLREFLCSEAMHALGVPTTRAGSVVTSKTVVERDIFYSGNPQNERCTIITRIAPTFIRFGSFEIFKGYDKTTGRKGPSTDNIDLLIQLLNYTIETFYPEIWSQYSSPSDRYLAFYREVVLRTARLVAEWQCVGFCHGVLNTDNMSIVGLTLDYGPFGFMEHFDPALICNTSDDGGRYTYEAQPEICRWNCGKLAEALSPVLPLSESRGELEKFRPEFERVYYAKMFQKLGLQKQLPEDKELLEDFFSVMQQTGADFTNSFRCLSRVNIPNSQEPQSNEEAGKESETVRDPIVEYLLVQCSDLASQQAKNKPKIPLENLQRLIALAQQDPRMLAMVGISNPAVLIKELEKYEKLKEMGDITEQQKTEKDREAWTQWIRKYRARLTQEIEDGADIEAINQKRVQIMNGVNPKYILRNYIAQRAIEKAEKDDNQEAQHVYDLLSDPFTERDVQHGIYRYDTSPPSWAASLCVSCSS